MPLPLGPFPYILTNGTLADANQVMADFNLLLNGINGLAPLAVPVAGSSSNIAANLGTAGTSITVTADTLTLATALNGTAYTLTSYSQSFNGATTGPGGMDTGALPTSSFVALYAIYNPTAPAISILGKSAAVSAPTIYNGANMPAGYTASALLCVLPTNATPAIKACFVRGKTVTFGAVTGPTTTVNVTGGTAASIAAAVPPNAISVGGYLTNTAGTTPGTGGVVTNVSTDASQTGVQNLTYNPANIGGNAQAAPFANLLLSTPQTIYWGAAVAGTGPSASVVISQYTIP